MQDQKVVLVYWKASWPFVSFFWEEVRTCISIMAWFIIFSGSSTLAAMLFKLDFATRTNRSKRFMWSIVDEDEVDPVRDVVKGVAVVVCVGALVLGWRGTKAEVEDANAKRRTRAKILHEMIFIMLEFLKKEESSQTVLRTEWDGRSVSRLRTNERTKNMTPRTPQLSSYWTMNAAGSFESFGIIDEDWCQFMAHKRFECVHCQVSRYETATWQSCRRRTINVFSDFSIFLKFEPSNDVTSGTRDLAKFLKVRAIILLWLLFLNGILLRI